MNTDVNDTKCVRNMGVKKNELVLSHKTNIWRMTELVEKKGNMKKVGVGENWWEPQKNKGEIYLKSHTAVVAASIVGKDWMYVKYCEWCSI